MRKREEIQKESEYAWSTSTQASAQICLAVNTGLILEVLLDIRQILIESKL